MDCDFSSIQRNVFVKPNDQRELAHFGMARKTRDEIQHLPMHVHIQNSDGKAKIAINPNIVLVENNGIKPRDIKRAVEITRMYQKEFIKAWEDYHGE